MCLFRDFYFADKTTVKTLSAETLLSNPLTFALIFLHNMHVLNIDNTILI